MDIDGVILSGGQSRRMQSLGMVDKGLLRLAGLALAGHAAKRLMPYCRQLLISANTCQADYAEWGKVVGDGEFIGQGPLAGILAAMRHTRADYILILSVDSPRVSEAVIAELVAQAKRSPTTSALYAYAAQAHPLCAIIRTDLAPALERYLLQGKRRVQQWYTQIEAQPVCLGEKAEALFLNVNTPDDWQQAQSESR